MHQGDEQRKIKSEPQSLHIGKRLEQDLDSTVERDKRTKRDLTRQTQKKTDLKELNRTPAL